MSKVNYSVAHLANYHKTIMHTPARLEYYILIIMPLNYFNISTGSAILYCQ